MNDDFEVSEAGKYILFIMNILHSCILSSILKVLWVVLYKTCRLYKYGKINIKYSHISIFVVNTFFTVSKFKLNIKILRHFKYKCCLVSSGLNLLNYSLLYINVSNIFTWCKRRNLMLITQNCLFNNE